jgi:hypothetical protein
MQNLNGKPRRWKKTYEDRSREVGYDDGRWRSFTLALLKLRSKSTQC